MEFKKKTRIKKNQSVGFVMEELLEPPLSLSFPLPATVIPNCIKLIELSSLVAIQYHQVNVFKMLHFGTFNDYALKMTLNCTGTALELL